MCLQSVFARSREVHAALNVIRIEKRGRGWQMPSRHREEETEAGQQKARREM
jgi:hypothetical protein